MVFENGVSIISNFIGKKCNPLLTASRSLFKYMASANSFNIILTTSARVKFDFRVNLTKNCEDAPLQSNADQPT